MTDTKRIALLSGLPREIETPVREAFALLQTPPIHCISLQQVNDEKQINALIKNTREQYKRIDILINAGAVLASLPSFGAKKSQTDTALLAYPPYALYRAVLTLMQTQSYGRIVNAYGGINTQGERRSGTLSLPSLRSLGEDLLASTQDADILFNSVNIAPPEAVNETEHTRIAKERIDTLVWLATVAADGPQQEFFRGYTDK